MDIVDAFDGEGEVSLCFEEGEGTYVWGGYSVYGDKVGLHL